MSTRYTRAADKELNEKHTKILIELLQKPENKFCADCKKKDPRWASWNLGIFICIRCSGTHRSLGTHISKVKSVDLDTWIPEQIENMLQLGNSKANAYWEAKLNGKVPTDTNIDAWIRAKYQHKKWVIDDSLPETQEHTDKKESSADDSAVVESAVIESTVEELEISQPSFGNDYRSSSKQKEEPTIIVNSCTQQAQTQPSPTKRESAFDFSSFQQQLSGLSVGQSTAGLIPKAPPGSNTSWKNFLIGKSPDTTNNALCQPSNEKPLISYDALASLLKQ